MLYLLSKQNLFLGLLAALLVITYSAVVKLHSPTVQLPSGGQPQESPHTTLIEPGLFEVEIPERFEQPPHRDSQVIEVESTNQTVPFTSFSYESEAKPLTRYVVAYIRFPKQIFETKTEQELLDDMRRGEVERYHGNLKRESTLFESPDVVRRQVRIVSSAFRETLYARSELIISKPYGYLLSYSSPKPGAVDGPRADSFFESFRLYRQGPSRRLVVR